ncbi:UbiA family prenyltransferase [Methylopila turkensis]|nr:UbiA family prenyltransferase [Methylopila turkensis]
MRPASMTLVEEVRRPAPSGLAPLAVDVDGTLIRGDLLAEQALVFLRNPLRIFTLLFWMLKGRAALKRRLSESVEIDVEALPVNEELVAFIEAERAKGREIHLATASDALVAAKLAARFGFVDGVIASDGVSNLKGEAKAAALTKRFPGGFAYAGDAAADLPVWRAARETVVVGARASTLKAAEAIRPPLAVIPRPRIGARTVAKAARVHQWAKNALVFVPMVLGGKALDLETWAVTLAGFVLLGILASSTYLLNDLWDINDDRRHWSKRDRAFASGRLPIAAGLAAAPIGILIALGGAALIGWGAFFALLGYLVVTLAYSFRLKQVAVLDVFTLAGLFTMRLVVGVALAGVVASPWLLVFSMFIFASLSFAKRHTEMVRVALAGKDKAAGRGYIAADAPFLICMGTATGMSAVLVMVLYIFNEAFPAGMYQTPGALWAFPCVLFLWLGRVWVLSGRDELHDDPVAFAVRDRPSIALGVVMALAFVAAIAPVGRLW